MIIAQISDSHIDPDDPDAAPRVRDLGRCVDAINGLDRKPDVVIHTGDLTHNGTPAKYEVAAGILSALDCPIHFAAGNRDDRAAIREIYPAARYLLPDTPFVQYVIDDYPVRLIALDTLSEATNMGDFCEVRAASLRKALGEETTKPTAIFMHHPPFEVHASKYKWQYDSPEAIATLGRALEGQRQVVRAFCGHAHRDATGMIGEVVASCMPSVAIDLRLGDVPDAAEAAPVYQIHKFEAGRGFVSETRVAA